MTLGEACNFARSSRGSLLALSIMDIRQSEKMVRLPCAIGKGKPYIDADLDLSLSLATTDGRGKSDWNTRHSAGR